jgi:hypothetical protein
MKNNKRADTIDLSYICHSPPIILDNWIQYRYMCVNSRRKCQGLLFINIIPEESKKNDERKTQCYNHIYKWTHTMLISTKANGILHFSFDRWIEILVFHSNNSTSY